MKSNRLLKTYETAKTDSLEDLIYIAALNLEDALLTGGAVPGKDYKIIDLYKISMPMAIAMYNKIDNVDYVVGYPIGHPSHKEQS